MATITAFIRTTQKTKTEYVRIRFRLHDGRDVQLHHRSDIVVPLSIWDNKTQSIKQRAVFDDIERDRITERVAARKKLIREIYNNTTTPKEERTSEWLDREINQRLHPQKHETVQGQPFFDAFEEYLIRSHFSELRTRLFHVLIKALKRFEKYNRITADDKFTLSLDGITTGCLDQFEKYLREEHYIVVEYPVLYSSIPKSRIPKPRGQNTINEMMKKFRTFFIWANRQEKTKNNPFEKYTIGESVYGTPYYISVDERNRIYRTDLSRCPALEISRDVFVFQCLIGCRVSDYFALTKKNIINGAIEYIAGKTKEDRPATIRVPLNSIAREILKKYEDCGEQLLPFPKFQQDYNEHIKQIFLAARITRPVVVLDSLTRKPVIRPLNEIASSHIARRTFVGNLYKQVRDPNLVGALSGHREGSKAFARYRDIDEEMKTDLVKLLE